MLKKSEAPLNLELRPSRVLAGLITGVCGASILVMFLLPVPLWLKVLIALSVAVAGYRCVNQEAWRKGKGATTRLVWQSNDQWALVTIGNISCQARLVGDAFVHHYLVVLNFVLADGRKRSIVVVAGVVDGDTFRRLRARLSMAPPQVFRKENLS